LFTGCLEVSEEIHVNESGEARVVITLEGDEDEFSSVVSPCPLRTTGRSILLRSRTLIRKSPK